MLSVRVNIKMSTSFIVSETFQSCTHSDEKRADDDIRDADACRTPISCR